MKTFIISMIVAFAFSMNLKAQEAQVAIHPSVSLKDSVLTSGAQKQQANRDTSIFQSDNKEDQFSDDNHGREFYWFSGKKKKNQTGRFNGHWKAIELGFNGFGKPDYSMYNGNEFMTLKQGKSIEVDVNFYEVNIGLYKSYVGLVSGMGLSFNDYRFEEPYTLMKGPQITEPVLLNSDNLSKTKLSMSYLQVPLLFEFQIPINHNESRVFVNAGIIGGVRIGTHTKVKHGNDKDKNHSGFNINPFKYAATARIGYKKVGLFGTYSLTPLFESGKGPELTPFTVGISFF